MEMTEKFLQNNRLHDADDFDALLELADLVRTLIAGGQHADLSRVLRYVIEQGCFEALSWCLEILQEEFQQEGCALSDFACPLGSSIPNYDGFIEVLKADLTHPRNDTETICDKNGEVTSFFNILVYNTGYDRIRLVSRENFDIKDNDFVQYALTCSAQ